MSDRFEIRWAVEEDRPAIINTIRDVFSGEEEFAKMADFFTSSLHASGKPETTCMAIEKSTGRIAAVEITAQMSWMYGGIIPLKTLVLLLTGTHPDFRGCGAMSFIHETLQKWLYKNDFDLSFVDGIPWYYRRLGFIPLGLMPDRTVYDRFSLPDGKQKLKNIIIRPFEERDLTFAAEVLKYKAEGMLYSFTYDQSWAKMFTLDYFEENSDLSATICNIEGDPIGVMICYTKHCSGQMVILDYALKPGISHLDLTPAVLEFLAQEGDRQMGQPGGCKYISLPYDVNTQEILADCLSKAQYVNKRQCKLVDLVRFLKKIAPALDKRIATSPICGYSRTIRVELFGHKQGLDIAFKDGCIADVEWRNTDFINEALDIQIPYEKFIRLIFGVESIDDMLQEHREVNSWNGDRLDNEMRLLLKTLFPKRLSYIMHSC